MLKKMVIVIALVLMLATTAGAAQLSWLIGAAGGNISGSGNVVFMLFNASVNQKLAIVTLPAYTSLNPYCTMYPLNSASNSVSGSGNTGVAMIAPVTDLYVAYCQSFNSSATANVWLYVIDLDRYSIMAQETPKEPADKESAALNQLIQENIKKLEQVQ
ncbi:MAG: hypothetical protein HQL03_15390 [Nitrospirae bacterium]|nr:hypothetical protein [Nitrospirota bacterium]MBF0592585.1 hypothetical protein [Nitrospirota bacterium]